MQTGRIAPLLLPWTLACSINATAADAIDARDTPSAEANAAASQPSAAPAPRTATAGPSAPDKKWHFATIGYVFAAGAYGKSTPREPLPAVDIDLSPRDVLDVFKLAFMGAAEARKNRVVFLGDLMWVHLSGSKGLTVRNREFSDVELNSKTTAISILGGYRIVDKGPVKVELLAGGRLNRVKQKLDYSGTLLSLSASVSKTWVDPVLATRVNAPLSGKTSLSLYGDIGGAGIGSDFTWQAAGAVNYQISRKIRAGLGWRYFKINYDDSDGFLYNVAQSGPIITLRTDF